MTTAAFGGKSSSENGEVSIDTGEGLDEMSDEQLLNLKEMLGESDFYNAYPQMRGVI